MNNPIKKMLRTHLPYCQMNDQKVRLERSCTCYRDNALALYSDIEDFLLHLDEWLEENDTLASNSVAHHNLEKLIERLV